MLGSGDKKKGEFGYGIKLNITAFVSNLLSIEYIALELSIRQVNAAISDIIGFNLLMGSHRGYGETKFTSHTLDAFNPDLALMFVDKFPAEQ